MVTCSAQPLRIVVVGHVDHGKSTLIGRLAHDSGQIPESTLAQMTAVAARRGVAFELATLTDALQVERDQHITVDVAHVWLQSKHRRFVVIDAPGHRELMRNMITGAAHADAAAVVIDAAEGVQEQSRRHAVLLTLLGVAQLAVVVNKMDLVGFSAGRFERIADDYYALLKSIGIAPTAIVPAAARDGVNVALRSPALAWYHGPTVLEVFEQFHATVPLAAGPFRFPIQDVYRVDGRQIFVGRVEAGSVRVGDHVQVLPDGAQSRVKTIERWKGPPGAGRARAEAGESIGMTLIDPMGADRGEVACGFADSPHVKAAFHARVFWMGRRPLVRGRRYRLRLTTQEADCEIATIERVVDGAMLTPRTADRVTTHDVAEVEIRSDRSLVFDIFRCVPTLGRFVMVDEADVAGGGTIVREAWPEMRAGRHRSNVTKRLGQISPAERYRRNGHRSAMVWLTGLSGSGKSTIAVALERALCDRGMQAFVLDGDNLRRGITSDLGFSPSDRVENVRRVAHVARLLADAGVIAIAALISPCRRDRLVARELALDGGVPFCEVFLDVPLAVCEGRDPKGLYAKARSGALPDFTGVSAPYEPPDVPEIVLRTHELTVDESTAILMDELLPRLKQAATEADRSRFHQMMESNPVDGSLPLPRSSTAD